MRSVSLFASLLIATWTLGGVTAFSAVPSPTRRAVLATPLVVVAVPEMAHAFDGSGVSSYSGRNVLSTATKAKGYRDRIVADVKDFKALGAAIEQGETSGKGWVDVFTTFQRREADPVGRTYAAQIDLLGAEKSGGAALLLVNTYCKPNKPPDNLPQYKKYNSLAKTFGAIEGAGKAGDAAKAKAAWLKAAAALSEYLDSVELPGDLSDALYS